MSQQQPTSSLKGLFNSFHVSYKRKKTENLSKYYSQSKFTPLRKDLRTKNDKYICILL